MATGDKQASPQPVGQPQPGQQSGQIHCCTFFYQAMWLNVAGGVTLIILTGKIGPQLLGIVLPIGLVWCVAPLLMSWLSRQPVRKVFFAVSGTKNSCYARQAVKSGHFFETFATEKENWLPPDNYQEIPQPTVAHRTSPTNIGLSLMANLTAWDFGQPTGYISGQDEEVLFTDAGAEFRRSFGGLSVKNSGGDLSGG